MKKKVAFHVAEDNKAEECYNFIFPCDITNKYYRFFSVLEIF